MIIFDLDAEDYACIGYKLPEDNVLVNNGSGGRFFGRDTAGIVINNGKHGMSFAGGTSGIFIQNNKSEESLSSVVLGRPKNYSVSPVVLRCDVSRQGDELGKRKFRSSTDRDSTRCLILSNEECDKIPDLKKYLDGLEEITKSIKDEQSAKRFLDRYGPEPKERIETEIKGILRKGRNGSADPFPPERGGFEI